MNPLRFPNEIMYYERILEQYKCIQQGKSIESFDTFASREIIFVLKELKEEEERQKKDFGDIAKNSIILLLTLMRNEDYFQFKHYFELKEREKKEIKSLLYQVIN